MATARTRCLRISLAIGLLVGIVLSGCATSRGFGQDVQSLGRNIEKVH
jgi:predicted small secreted protein